MRVCLSCQYYTTRATPTNTVTTRAAPSACTPCVSHTHSSTRAARRRGACRCTCELNCGERPKPSSRGSARTQRSSSNWRRARGRTRPCLSPRGPLRRAVRESVRARGDGGMVGWWRRRRRGRRREVSSWMVALPESQQCKSVVEWGGAVVEPVTVISPHQSPTNQH